MSALILIVNSEGVCICCVCVRVLEPSVCVDMSVCVAVVSAWLHHCAVRLKLPALSSKLQTLYVTNSAFTTQSDLQYAVFEPYFS